MRLYYKDESIRLYHGDARDWFGTADVLITDPPYGVGLSAVAESGYRGKENVTQRAVRQPYSDDPTTVRALLTDVMPRLLGLVDRALIFCGPRMLYAYPEPAAIGSVFTPNGAGRSPWGFQTTHPILYYGNDPYLTDGKGSRPNGFRTEQPNTEKVNHPCPKPLSWMRWAVARASREGELVLDPFAGSGTTLVAAKALGRRAVGVELEEAYCEEAVRRLGQETLGLSFLPSTAVRSAVSEPLGLVTEGSLVLDLSSE